MMTDASLSLLVLDVLFCCACALACALICVSFWMPLPRLASLARRHANTLVVEIGWTLFDAWLRSTAVVTSLARWLSAWARHERCAACVTDDEGREWPCGRVAPHELALDIGAERELILLCSRHEPYAMCQLKRFAYVDQQGRVSTLTLH